MTSYTEKTEVFYDPSKNTTNTILQFISRAKNKIDICGDYRAFSLFIGLEICKNNLGC